MALPVFDFDIYIHKPYNYTIEPDQYEIINGPTTLTDVFKFTVTPSFEDNSLLQVVIVAGSNVIYTRERIEDEFGDWKTTTGGGGSTPPQYLSHLYVSKADNASDANPGTVVEPLATIQAGIFLNEIADNPFLEVDSGLYPEDLVIANHFVGLTIQGYSSGNDSLPTILGNTITIEGTLVNGSVTLRALTLTNISGTPFILVTAPNLEKVNIENCYIDSHTGNAIIVTMAEEEGGNITLIIDNTAIPEGTIHLDDMPIGRFGTLIMRNLNPSIAIPVEIGLGWTVYADSSVDTSNFSGNLNNINQLNVAPYAISSIETNTITTDVLSDFIDATNDVIDFPMTVNAESTLKFNLLEKGTYVVTLTAQATVLSSSGPSNLLIESASLGVGSDATVKFPGFIIVGKESDSTHFAVTTTNIVTVDNVSVSPTIVFPQVGLSAATASFKLDNITYQIQKR